MKSRPLSILFLILFSSYSFSEHLLGVALGYGNQEFKLNQTTNDGDAFNIDAYYRYMMNPYIGIEGGWTSAVGGIGSFIVAQVAEIEDARFSGPKINLFLQYPLSSNNYIYTKLGANNYTLDYTINRVSKEDSNAGFEGSLGLESRFNSGLGLNVEYKNINNPIIKANQFIMGMSYKF